MKCSVAMASLALAWVAALAAAQNQQPGFDQATAWSQMQQQLLLQFDLNKDGKLTGQEQMQAQEAMRRQGINLGIPPGGFPGAEQFNKQFDRNRDGKLDPMEMMAAQAAYQRLRNNGANGGGGGGVSRGSVPQPAPRTGWTADQAPSNVPPLIKRFDKDGDGKLNAAEKEAAQAELKKTKPKDAKEKDAKENDAKDKAEKNKIENDNEAKGAKGK